MWEGVGGIFIVVVPVGGNQAALASLPIEALRLPADVTDGLHLLGFERVAQLAATRAPRWPAASARWWRRGSTRRWARCSSRSCRWCPPELVQARLTFVEPLLTAEAFATVIARLVGTVCAELEKAGQGARRLDLLFERVDGSVQPLRIGTAAPVA